MKKIKLLAVLLVLTVLGLSVVACGKKEETEEKAEIVDTTSADVSSPEDIDIAPEGMIPCELTGEWIDESFKDQRPLCCMIHNLEVAMPQSSVGQADIIYEMEVEGGITRLMAVFHDYSALEKLGPIRSARHYYVQTAMEYDAIFAHVGQSIFAEDEIASSKINNLNGLTNSMIFRDNTRVAPDNAYTNSEKLADAISSKDYPTTHNESYDQKFFISKNDYTPEDGTAANKVTTAYNEGRKPWFEYNKDDGLYYRFQYGDKQIDKETNEQLAFKNVIIQFTTQAPLEGLLIDITLTGTNDGIYITNGQAIPITWEKDGIYGVCHYYTMDGEELKVNKGKTWITIFSDAKKDAITFE